MVDIRYCQILVLILDFFQEKLVRIFFKTSKKPYFGAILGPFLSNLGKNEFSLIFFFSLSFLFKYSNYIVSCKKLEETNEPFLRKTLNWLTDGQRDNGDFVRPSVGRGSNNTMFIFYVLKINWFPGQSLKMIPNLKNSP